MITIKIVIAQAMGYFVLLPACMLHLWTEPTYPSIKPLTTSPGVYTVRHVDEWRWDWLNAWYGNSEDGVSGQQAWIYDDAGHLVSYASTFPHWMPKWAIAYAWSAWRNGANNVKRPLRTDGLNTPWKPQ